MGRARGTSQASAGENFASVLGARRGLSPTESRVRDMDEAPTRSVFADLTTSNSAVRHAAAEEIATRLASEDPAETPSSIQRSILWNLCASTEDRDVAVTLRRALLTQLAEDRHPDDFRSAVLFLASADHASPAANEVAGCLTSTAQEMEDRDTGFRLLSEAYAACPSSQPLARALVAAMTSDEHRTQFAEYVSGQDLSEVAPALREWSANIDGTLYRNRTLLEGLMLRHRPISASHPLRTAVVDSLIGAIDHDRRKAAHAGWEALSALGITYRDDGYNDLRDALRANLRRNVKDGHSTSFRDAWSAVMQDGALNDPDLRPWVEDVLEVATSPGSHTAEGMGRAGDMRLLAQLPDDLRRGPQVKTILDQGREQSVDYFAEQVAISMSSMGEKYGDRSEYRRGCEDIGYRAVDAAAQAVIDGGDSERVAWNAIRGDVVGLYADKLTAGEEAVKELLPQDKYDKLKAGLPLRHRKLHKALSRTEWDELIGTALDESVKADLWCSFEGGGRLDSYRLIKALAARFDVDMSSDY